MVNPQDYRYPQRIPEPEKISIQARRTVDNASLASVVTGYGAKGINAVNTSENLSGLKSVSKEIFTQLKESSQQAAKTVGTFGRSVANSENAAKAFNAENAKAAERLSNLGKGLSEGFEATAKVTPSVTSNPVTKIQDAFSAGKLGKKIQNSKSSLANIPFKNNYDVQDVSNLFQTGQLKDPDNVKIGKVSAEKANATNLQNYDLGKSGISKKQTQATGKLVDDLTEAKKLSESITFSKLEKGATAADTKLAKIGTRLVKLADQLDQIQWFTFAVASADVLIDKIGKIRESFQNVQSSLNISKMSGVDTSNFEDLNEKFGTVGKSASTIASGFTGNQEVVSLAERGNAAYNQFSQAKAQVGTVFKGDDLDGFTRSIQDLVGGDLKNAVTSTEALAGAYEVLSSGFTGAQESLNVLSAGLKLSVSSGAESGQVLRLLGKTLNAYSKEASEAASVAGLLNRTVENGITTIPELSQGFGQAASVAKEAGASIESLAASVGTLTSAGTSTSRAFTQIKRFSSEISSGKLQRRIEDQGITDENGDLIQATPNQVSKTSLQEVAIKIKQNTSSDQLSKLLTSSSSREFVINIGTEGGEKALATLDNIKQTSEAIGESLSQALEKNLENVFNIKLDTDEVLKFKQVSNEAAEALIKIGGAVAPAFESGISKLNQLADTISNVANEYPGLIENSVKAALGVKAVGESVKQLAGGATQITLMFAATRLFTGALFKQVGALVDVNKGWRSYNAVASQVVNQNGRILSSFEKIGLVLSQLTGFGAGNIEFFDEKNDQYGKTGARTPKESILSDVYSTSDVILDPNSPTEGKLLYNQREIADAQRKQAYGDRYIRLNSAFDVEDAINRGTVTAPYQQSTPSARVSGRSNPVSRFNNLLANPDLLNGFGFGTGTSIENIGRRRRGESLLLGGVRNRNNAFYQRLNPVREAISASAQNAQNVLLGRDNRVAGGIGERLGNIGQSRGFQRIENAASTAAQKLGEFGQAIAPSIVSLGSLAVVAVAAKTLITAFNQVRQTMENFDKSVKSIGENAVEGSRFQKNIQKLDEDFNRKKEKEEKEEEPGFLQKAVKDGNIFGTGASIFDSVDRFNRFKGDEDADSKKFITDSILSVQTNATALFDQKTGSFDERNFKREKIAEEIELEKKDFQLSKKRVNNIQGNSVVENDLGFRSSIREAEVKSAKDNLKNIKSQTTEFERQLESEKEKLSKTANNPQAEKARAAIQSEIDDIEIKLKKSQSQIPELEKFITNQENKSVAERTLDQRFDDREKAEKENKSVSAVTREVAFEERRKEISELGKKVLDVGVNKEIPEDAVKKIDTLAQDQLNTITEQVKAGELTPQEGLQAIQNVRDQELGKFDGETKTLEDFGSAELEVVISQSSINIIDEQISQLKEKLESQKIALQAEADVGLINRSEIKQQFANLENDRLSQELNSVNKQIKIADDKGQNAKVRELENKRTEIISKQRANELQVQNAPLNIQQSNLKLQQQSELTRTDLNTRNIGALEEQKLENRLSQQQKIVQNLEDQGATEEEIAPYRRSIKTTKTKLAQQDFQNFQTDIDLKQEKLRQTNSSFATSSNSISQEIRQLDIQDQQGKIQRKSDLVQRLVEEEAPDAKIAGLRTELNFDRQKLTQLKAGNRLATVQETNQTELTRVEAEAQAEKSRITPREGALSQQVRATDAASNLANTGLSSISNLSNIINGLDISDKEKKSFQSKALDAEKSIVNEKYNIEKQILALEKRKLALAQRKAEIEAGVDVSKAEANLKEVKAETAPILAEGSNATQAEKEAARARLQAADDRLEGAKQNVAIVDQTGEVNQIIKNVEGVGLDVKNRGDNLSIDGRKAASTPTKKDDYAVADRITNVLEGITDNLADAFSNLSQRINNIFTNSPDASNSSESGKNVNTGNNYSSNIEVIKNNSGETGLKISDYISNEPNKKENLFNPFKSLSSQNEKTVSNKGQFDLTAVTQNEETLEYLKKQGYKESNAQVSVEDMRRNFSGFDNNYNLKANNPQLPQPQNKQQPPTPPENNTGQTRAEGKPVSVNAPVTINIDVQGSADEDVIDDLESRLTTMIQDQVITELNSVGDKIQSSFDLI